MLMQSQIMHTNQPTAEQAVAQWAHHYYQIVPNPAQTLYPDQTVIESGEGMGQSYRHEITYKIVVVQYRYTPRGRWITGYVGYAPVTTTIYR